MGCQADPFLIFRGLEERIEPSVQSLETISGRRPRADVIEYVHEHPVLLPVDLLKLDHNVVQSGKGLRTEEEGTWIDLLEERSFGFLDHWRKLLDVTYHQELHSSERLVVPSVPAKFVVHSIQDVCPDHRDFVDDQQIQRPVDVYPFPFDPTLLLRHLVLCDKFPDVRKIGTQRQLKEGVNGHSSCIHRGHPCRGYNRTSFGGVSDYFPKKGGLSGSGFAGKEN